MFSDRRGLDPDGQRRQAVTDSCASARECILTHIHAEVQLRHPLFFLCAQYDPACSLIRLLPVMRLPPAFRELHIGKYRSKGRVLRRTRIDAEPDLPLSFVHMADPHLAECGPVR